MSRRSPALSGGCGARRERRFCGGRRPTSWLQTTKNGRQAVAAEGESGGEKKGKGKRAGENGGEGGGRGGMSTLGTVGATVQTLALDSRSSRRQGTRGGL